MPQAAVVMGLVPFFALGLLARFAVGGFFFVLWWRALWLDPWLLAAMPVGLALLALGAGRWALDPIGPGVIWARGVGAIMGRHPTNTAWRQTVERQLEEQEARKR